MSKEIEKEVLTIVDDGEDDLIEITGASKAELSIVDLTEKHQTDEVTTKTGDIFVLGSDNEDEDIEILDSKPPTGTTTASDRHRSRSTVDNSFVQFAGTKRPRSVAHNFNQFRNGFSFRSLFRDNQPLQSSTPNYASSRSSFPLHNQVKTSGREAKKNQSAEKNTPSNAMSKGKEMQTPKGFDALQIFYPRLKAAERTAILYNLIKPLSTSYTKKSVHDFRVRFEQTNKKPTLWSLAKGLSEDFVKVEWDPVKITCKTDKQQSEAAVVDSKVGASESIGPISAEMLETLDAHFQAHVRHAYHKANLAAIKPTNSGPDALSCCICSDEFDPANTIACTGESSVHFFCRPCLASYCTVTLNSGPIQTISCPVTNCKSLFSVSDLKSTLSEWEILMIEHRESSRDRRVALAGKAVLHCECGVVAIVTEEDMGDGRIACPGNGCGRRFCAKCGNEDHGKGTCPPPAETVQWLDKNSKECPNCRNRIEKNGGCDHMTCQPPGGCGYEFWWTCGCPFRGQHRPGCQRMGEMTY